MNMGPKMNSTLGFFIISVQTLPMVVKGKANLSKKSRIFSCLLAFASM